MPDNQVTILMPLAGRPGEAAPIFALDQGKGIYKILGNVSSEREGWKYEGPLLRCILGEIAGMKGLIAVEDLGNA